MAVQKIPDNVQSLLSASARVNNFKNAIEELVYNSLDAESSSIAIRVHIQNNWIQVVDNGNGIKNVDFKLVGQRYATSKLSDINILKEAPSKFGYKGQALANIIEVSQTVKITSRSANSNETWLKTFFEGKERECRIVAIRPSVGTTVEVNGFLFNQKIQRKSINHLNELQDVKMFLEHMVLVFNNVSVSLRDDSDNEIIFKIHKNRDIYQTFKSIFEIESNDMQELQVQKNEYKIKAFIGIKEIGFKKFQWIYVNNKFVHNSNLHDIINHKLLDTLGRTRAKINKMKRAFNEENFECQSIPLYFLFITCPLYEYDIINSAKQTTIEFKDWEEIKKLIEKLVKFYNGDTHLKKENNNNNKKQTHVENTRSEVKKIIEKILRSHNNNKPRASQMQNGVKGKGVKRKNKKVLPQISAANRKTNVSYKCSNNADSIKKSPDVKTITKSPQKNCLSKVHPNSPNIRSSKHKRNQKCRKFTKQPVKRKCCKRSVNLIDIFKNNTNTLKQRCEEFSCYIKDLMKAKFCEIDKRNMKDKGIDIYSNGKNSDSENAQTSKKEEQNSSAIAGIELYAKNSSNIEKNRSYDLLQTILKTQQSFYKQDSRNECPNVNIRNTSNVDQSQSIPKLTFESHKYNGKHTIAKDRGQRKLEQTSKQPRDKFILPLEKCKTDFHVKTGKITKTKTKYIRRRNFTAYYRLLNKYKQDILESSLSIDTCQGSDIIELSKMVRNQIVNDMKIFLDTERNNKIKLRNKNEQSNFKVNVKIENTYTILVDSFHNSYIDPTVGRIETEIKNFNKKTYSGDVQVETNLLNNSTNNNVNIVYISESQHTFQADKSMAPIDMCEVVISNSNGLAEEFDGTFEVNKKSDTNTLKLQSDLSFRENSNDSQINISNNKIPTYEDSSLMKTTKRNKGVIEENIFDKEINYQDRNEGNYKISETRTFMNESADNFKLISRHRFVPKGTSPIFKNCFSKDICSYNLDRDYYEDNIYNNFIKNVEINSEIFEPNVQTMKELTTIHLQKVTDKLKKNNADLIFKADSLTSAKAYRQVDCKFIAAKISGKSVTHKLSNFLVLFDQHAVHERIKLENNLLYYFSDSHWKSVTIEAISMKVSKDEILYLHNHKDKFIQFGLEWLVLNNCEILVNGIPEAILGKNPRPTETIVKAVRNLITEQINSIKCLKGNISLHPQSIMNFIFSEACRYAIKFGDILSTKKCQDLIIELAKCKTPFQCAHGRPVMAVIMELEGDTNKMKYEVNMQKVKQFRNEKSRSRIKYCVYNN